MASLQSIQKRFPSDAKLIQHLADPASLVFGLAAVVMAIITVWKECHRQLAASKWDKRFIQSDEQYSIFRTSESTIPNKFLLV